jgi:Protein of unknown function (DUF1428)
LRRLSICGFLIRRADVFTDRCNQRAIFESDQTINRSAVQPFSQSTPKETPMSYIDGFLIPVPTDKKEAYRALATKAAALFKEYGATRVVESGAAICPTAS